MRPSRTRRAHVLYISFWQYVQFLSNQGVRKALMRLTQREGKSHCAVLSRWESLDVVCCAASTA